jgi:uncharacterized protein with FMN-binding domain
MTVKENVSKKRGLKGCLIVMLVIVAIFSIAGGIGWIFLSKEHQEAASLPLNAVNFDRLSDGKYHGVYAGGMYEWRYNECDVTVEDGKVIEIDLTDSDDPGAENTNVEMLYERVIQAQNLQVDTISGSTLTSKGYLQCVENALVQAQHE